MKARRLRWPGWRPAPPRPRRLIDRLAAPLDELALMLLHEAPAGIAAIDRGGHLVRVNEALHRMAGRDCDLSPGRPVLSIFGSAQQGAVWEELAPVLTGRRARGSFVSTLCGRSGTTEHTVEVSASAVREADGAVSGAILHMADITAQRRLEAQLTQSQKLQAVGQLAGGIAHDFNNLLTAMLGAAEDALEREPPDAETLEDLQQIRSSAERGAALVRQLLAFGRQQALQPRPVSINDAVVSISGLLRRLLGSTVRLDLQLEQPGHTVQVDPTQLDQVLVNLAVNARDAMPDGGELTLRTGHITLFRALVRGEETIPPGRYVMVEVRDTGVGIPAEVLPRIFDPFFTTRRDRGGSGLGLSTVHGIIRQSDGFVAVDSLVGKGTRIRLYLPRNDADHIAIPALPPAPALPPELAPELASSSDSPSPVAAARRTVLLVDDEDGVRRLAERALAKAGFDVLSAASGEAALALLDAPGQTVDAVVSDVVMPGMDGPALVRAVRGRFAGVPAILASGYSEDAVRGDLKADGIVFLSKPYALKALVATVTSALRQLA